MPRTFLVADRGCPGRAPRCSLVLFAIALLASYIPALRATPVDPMIALRAQ